MDRKFDLDDVTLVPEIVSQISSRSECDIFYEENKLPIIAAPMDTVIDNKNYKLFLDNKIPVCIPRNVSIEHSFDENINIPYLFKSYGLSTIKKLLRINYLYRHTSPYKYTVSDKEFDELCYYDNILIDIANGHMNSLVEVIKDFKSQFPDKKIMVGNIANPKTFKVLSEAGADYVRISIGSGNACITGCNTGIYYPMGSLITECKEIKNYWKLETKIVADGGMKGYSDIIKSLALGADYVMIGSLFNKTIESCGETYYKGIKINNKLANYLFSHNFKLYKKYRGMSTKEVQRKWNKKKLRTSEGIVKKQLVEYTLDGWVDNFKDYLKSSMSYCNSKTLHDFIGFTQYVLITNNSLNRFKK